MHIEDVMSRIESVQKTLKKLPETWKVDPAIQLDIGNNVIVRILSTQGSSVETKENTPEDLLEFEKFGRKNNYLVVTGAYDGSYLNRIYDRNIYVDNKINRLSEDRLTSTCLWDPDTHVLLMMITPRPGLRVEF